MKKPVIGALERSKVVLTANPLEVAPGTRPDCNVRPLCLPTQRARRYRRVAHSGDRNHALSGSAAASGAWESVSTPTGNSLHDVECTDAGAYAVGSGGTIVER